MTVEIPVAEIVDGNFRESDSSVPEASLVQDDEEILTAEILDIDTKYPDRIDTLMSSTSSLDRQRVIQDYAMSYMKSKLSEKVVQWYDQLNPTKRHIFYINST
jgi:hypothetical protein